MKRSNIFAYIELSKLVNELTLDINMTKSKLLSQCSYFKIIPLNMLSDALALEWEAICEKAKQKGPRYNEDGQIIANEFKNTIDQMNNHQCLELTMQIFSIHKKIVSEFE